MVGREDIEGDFKLIVQEAFQSTIQGEGYWTGTSCDFIRLFGCPLGCSWCDTGYSDSSVSGKLPRFTSTIDDLVANLRSPRVVITGGEPFLQRELPDLVTAILATGRDASIETSGSFFQEVDDRAWITVSPKEHLNPRWSVAAPFIDRANELKIVISNGNEYTYYQKYQWKTPYRYLQPEWNRRDETTPLALALLSHHTETRLSLQTHKYIGAR